MLYEEAGSYILVICPAMEPGWFYIAELETSNGVSTSRGVECPIEGHEIELALSIFARFDWHDTGIEWQLHSHRAVSSPVWLNADETLRALLPRRTLQ